MSVIKLYKQPDTGYLIISSSKKELEKDYKLYLLLTIYGYDMSAHISSNVSCLKWIRVKKWMGKYYKRKKTTENANL